MSQRLMIKCPETGKPVFTGIAIDAQSFASATMTDNTAVNCQHCGNNHKWQKEDAFFEGAEPTK